MKGFLSEQLKVLVCLYSFAVCHFVVFSFFWFQEDLGKILFVLYILIAMCSLFIGTLQSLIISLLFLFFSGSYTLYISFSNAKIPFISQQDVSLHLLIIYWSLLLTSILLGGYINQIVNSLISERNELKQEVKQFVSIDPDTFFDNAYRMEYEIKREMKIVKRHGGKFTIVFIELDHYQEFLTVYGQQEMDHLLKTIGEKVNDSLRFTDKKFRYSKNKFAFLLAETSKENIEFVGNKLAETLKNHQLLNGKTVSLEYHISYEEYNENSREVDYVEFIQGVEKETVFYDL